MLDYWCENIIPKYEQDWNHSVSTAKGMIHGTLDFGYSVVEGIPWMVSACTSFVSNPTEPFKLLDSFNEASSSLRSHLDSGISTLLNANETDATYQNSRTLTSSSLSAITIARAGYGLAHSGYAVLRAGSISLLERSSRTSTSIVNNCKWVLPEKGGGALINGRWYTEHALERMAPRTPEVMANLEARF